MTRTVFSWGCLVFLTCIGTVTAAEQAAADFYVSPEGNDQWSGRLPQPRPDDSDGPFATLERARDAVRKLRAELILERPVTVMLRGGVYRRIAPLVLGPEDSGSPESPVIYQPYPGEKAVISGGRTITGWKPGPDGVWTAGLPEVKSGAWTFRQLFVNDQRRSRPRWPKQGTLTAAGAPQIDTSGWVGNLPADSDQWSKRTIQFRPGDLRPDWTNLDDVEVVLLQFWMEARLRIQRIDPNKSVVLFTGGSWRPLTWSWGYYVDNVFGALDAPGTWYLDRKHGILSYRPAPGEEMEKLQIVAPVTEQLVRLEGDPGAGRLVQHVILRGLSFAHTNWTLPAEGCAYIQAELPPSAAIHADGAALCRIEACELAHLGAWGIELRRGCRDNTIVRCTIRDVANGGIKIGEPDRCERDVDETRGTQVSDNRVLDAGQDFLGSSGIWIGQSGGNTICHNEIAGPLMWGISVGWNWSYFPLNRSRDNLIEQNHVHHVGTGILGAHAGIYALGTSPGTVIRNNHIHHIFHAERWPGAGEGIILDNGCCGILVENNLVHDAVAGGFGTNFNCFGNLILNNVFAYGKEYQLTVYGDAPSGRPQPKGELFARNIILFREGPLIKEEDWPEFATLWDYNLYFHEGGEPMRFMKYSFDEWKAKGLDEHSLVADPLFVDAKNGDFGLKPDSPALKLGFKPIDVSRVGPRE
jgi:hypothetical protein